MYAKSFTEHSHQSGTYVGHGQLSLSTPALEMNVEVDGDLDEGTKPSVTGMGSVYGGRAGKLLLPAGRVWDPTVPPPAKGPQDTALIGSPGSGSDSS